MTFISTLLAGAAIGAAIGYAVATVRAHCALRRLSIELIEQYTRNARDQKTADELTAALRGDRKDLEDAVDHATHRKD
jgi:hypothetical protein